MITLYDYQLDAIRKMHNGCILCGGVGSGKSRTSLAYYTLEQCGVLDPYALSKSHPKNLYIITTARKRDTLEWDEELAPFLLSANPEQNKLIGNKVVVDSWNNIKKYAEIKDAFFIFDEQRVVGYGAWSKSFLRITKSNRWILLSATPGDKWEDYIPVFLANGFYKNITEFRQEHLVYDQYAKFPKVVRYLGIKRLERLRNKILVDMDFDRKTVSHHEDIWCSYDKVKYKDVYKTRWDPYKKEPIGQASGLCYVLRRIVNEDPSRLNALLDIFKEHPKLIVFYNFDYERDLLKSIEYGREVEIAEWSGHAHNPLPKTNTWIYLVQYTAGCDGWNCITTDTVIFYSQNYSYKIMEQASGRIDRLNTPYTDLYYYHLKSRSGIDLGISRTLSQKKKFNERKFTKWD